VAVVIDQGNVVRRPHGWMMTVSIIDDRRTD
jgi:hypothetical protein